ncbi:MAG: TIM barrel protein [Spirochaetaceae bacterium]|nr:TIM barrel protein [Spirochaetaceae bacterium]
MKLALSVRVAEGFGDKRRATASLDDLARIACDNGYAALCMRASQLGTHSPPEEVRRGRQTLDAAGLAVSMVTGDFPIPENDDVRGPEALRDIGPYLDLAESLGSDLLRMCMKSDEDIPHAQRAADQAAERGLRLAHQCHTRSLFEEVDRSLDVLAAIDRPNFGLIYEPANLDHAGQEYGASTIRRFAPHIVNVYLQNHRVHPQGADSMGTWCRGAVPFDHVPMWEPGLPFDAILAALGDAGYDGYVTVHQAFASLSGPAEAAARTADYLRSIAPFD